MCKMLWQMFFLMKIRLLLSIHGYSQCLIYSHGTEHLTVTIN